MKIPGVFLLDREMDSDHNRCVITLVGEREAIQEAAIRGVGKAAELIDLTKHQGAHPRMGAADVVPFIPIDGVTVEDCVAMAGHVGEEIGSAFRFQSICTRQRPRRPIGRIWRTSGAGNLKAFAPRSRRTLRASPISATPSPSDGRRDGGRRAQVSDRLQCFSEHARTSRSRRRLRKRCAFRAAGSAL